MKPIPSLCRQSITGFSLTVLVLLMFTPSSLKACDICSVLVPAAGVEESGDFMVSFYGQYSYYGASPRNERFDSLITQTGIGYWLSDQWSLQLSIPLIYRKLGDQSKSGLGDIAALIQFRPVNQVNESSLFLVDVYAGVQMPTGDSSLLADERPRGHGHGHGHGRGGHSHVGHHLTLGSGSWDGIFGGAARWAEGPWQARLDMQYHLNTRGSYGFEFGNDFLTRLGGEFRPIMTDTLQVGVGAEFSFEYRGENSVDGIARVGSDKRVAYLGPTARIGVGDHLHFSVAWDLPVHGRHTGLNGAADQRVRFLLGWNF